MSLLICIATIQVVPKFAYAHTACKSILKRIESSALTDAYELFLRSPKKRNTFEDLPQTIRFRSTEYKVIAFLGEGVQGLAFKVEDKRGKKSIIKIFKDGSIPFPLSLIPITVDALKYYYMNIKTKTFYPPIGIDSQLPALRFRDMRAIPVYEILGILDQINAPRELRDQVAQKIEARSYQGYSVHNYVFDIDKFDIVVIDPF